MFGDERHDPEWEERKNELEALVANFEASLIKANPIFLEHEKYEHLIDYYEDMHRNDVALNVVDIAMKQYPYSSTFMIRKAQLLIELKQFDTAFEWITKAELTDGEDISICLTKADWYVWQGKHHDAIRLVKDYIEKADEEDKEDLFLELADIYEDCERYDRVVYCLKQAIHYNPTSEEALNRLWFCSELLENYESMLEFYTELLDQNPYSIMGWFNLGHCYAGLDKWNEAIESFEYALAIDDTFDEAYVDCADIYFNLKQYHKAIDLYLSAHNLHRISKEIYFQVGLCYERLKELNKARMYYRKSLNVDPEFDEAYFRIGETYESENRLNEALSSYEKAIKFYPENVYYLKSAAEIKVTLDDLDEAIKIYKTILQIDGLKKWQWIDLAVAYFSNSNFADAFDTIDEGIDRFKKKAELQYVKSAMLYNMNSKKEALFILEQALSSKFKHHSIIFALSDGMKNDEDVIQLIAQYKT